MIHSGPHPRPSLPVEGGGTTTFLVHSSLILLLRLPIPRDLLRFGELVGLQLAGDVVALLFRSTSLFAGQLSGRQIAPHIPEHCIFGDALALEIEPAEMKLRARIALL